MFICKRVDNDSNISEDNYRDGDDDNDNHDDATTTYKATNQIERKHIRANMVINLMNVFSEKNNLVIKMDWDATNSYLHLSAASHPFLSLSSVRLPRREDSYGDDILAQLLALPRYTIPFIPYGFVWIPISTHSYIELIKTHQHEERIIYDGIIKKYGNYI